jgi:hypothetical protein
MAIWYAEMAITAGREETTTTVCVYSSSSPEARRRRRWASDAPWYVIVVVIVTHFLPLGRDRPPHHTQEDIAVLHLKKEREMR